MNILSILDEGLYGLMVGLYSFLASVYNMLVNLAYDTDFTRVLGQNIENVTQPLYVLAGVFMLFRVAVSFLNYIVDPDKVSDSQAGAGKMLTRVIVSIVLLLLLSPTGVVYSYLSNLQNAILQSGVLGRITGTITMSIQDSILFVNPVNSLFDTVDAASDSNIKTCYYYSRYEDEKVKGFYKLEISSEKISNSTKIEKRVFYDKEDGLFAKKILYARFNTGTEKASITSKGDSTKKLNATVTFRKLDFANNQSYVDANTCPQFLDISGDEKTAKLCKKNDTGCSMTTVGTAWGGYSSLENMIVDLREKSIRLSSSAGYEATEDSGSSGINEIIDDGKEAAGKGSKFGVKNNNAVKFTRAIGSSFLECAADNNDEEGNYDECVDVVTNEMFTYAGDEKILGMIDDDKLSFSVLPSLIVGLIVIVFLVVLCVDVAVRSLKLLMLQTLAPIPIVSRIDPKDKIFDSWVKMYLATYADLFIKLIAISFGETLLMLAIKLDLDPLQSIFYILGILVFMKMLPSMISKLFGIDLAAGGFKESMSMLKAGIGAGTGAFLGAVSGAATGKGFGRVTGAFQGAFRGAGGGSKGKITAGAQAISAKNQRINTAKEQGLNFWDRAVATTGAALGISKGKAANEKLQKLNDVSSKNKALKEFLEGEAVKKNAVINDFTYKNSKGQDVKWSETYGKGRGPIGVGTLQAELERLQSMETKTIQENAIANSTELRTMRGQLDLLRHTDTSKMKADELRIHNQAIVQLESDLATKSSEVATKALSEHDIQVTEMKAAFAKAKTTAAAVYAKNNANDIEVSTKIQEVNDALEEAKLAGVNLEVEGLKAIDPASMDEKTIKAIKENTLTAQSKIGKEAEKEIAKERYGNTSK